MSPVLHVHLPRQSHCLTRPTQPRGAGGGDTNTDLAGSVESHLVVVQVRGTRGTGHAVLWDSGSEEDEYATQAKHGGGSENGHPQVEAEVQGAHPPYRVVGTVHQHGHHEQDQQREGPHRQPGAREAVQVPPTTVCG